MCKNLEYEYIKSIITLGNILNSEDVFLVVNNSGENFEKIRYDKDIMKFAHIFECTDEMNIDQLIDSLTKTKTVEYINPNYKKDLQVDKMVENINYRYDIINELIKKNNYKSYLEIGVRNPDHCFNLIKCELKHGVDPMVEQDHPVTFRMTSDEFFENNKSKYDIIFIDGLHLDFQVEMDIINSLNILNEGGSIVLHDCNPIDVYHQRENYYDTSTPAGWHWNGTVWKALLKVRSEIENIHVSVVDIDYGIGIIQKKTPGNKIVNDNLFFSYEKLDKNRKFYLNLISKEEFYTNYIKSDSDSHPVKDSINKGLTWLAKFDDYASMGILSQRIIEKLNSDVSCKAIIGETETKNELILNNLKKPKNSELGIMFAYPDMYSTLNGYKTKVIYTGVDTTGGIPNFTQNINNVDYILTPSTKSKERMQKLGVIKPIFVFPHGIDPNVFTFKPRTITDKFKFLYVGECSDRKGIFQLLEAFTDLYKGNTNVELHIKSNSAMLFYNGEEIKKIKEENPNIFWHISDEGHDVVLKLYEECHAYVYPSRADTFGMTLLEAMACGLPVISTSDPGATEFIKNRYYEVNSKNVPVKNHPWMLGMWGEPNVYSLKNQMSKVYQNYESIINGNTLKDNSDYVRTNLSWDKVTKDFEDNILPKFNKTYKVVTLLTSFNRPHHIGNIINSLKEISEPNVINHTYIVDNSDDLSKKDLVVDTIKNNINKNFTLYVSEFNMGQRGALLQMLEDINLDDYDFIQFSDQDNIFNEKISTYCDILLENEDITFVTGYMSKEHTEMGWRNTRFGRLCEKRSIRAGHMFMRVSDFKKLLPIHLDGEYGQPWNSSWNAGLDWELTYWNKNSIGKNSNHNFALCVPNGVVHKGVDSTFYEWDVEANEYKSEELIRMRYEEEPVLQD